MKPLTMDPDVGVARGGEFSSVYAEKALCQMPRLLSLLDRNPCSPTYGCFHRDYWLYKTSDFPDAVRQFGVQALALVYAHHFPGNPYRANPKVRDWAIAAMNYWASIQHRDGSFDEFYPYERGWVGPTAFTTFAVAEAFRLLKEEISGDVAERVLAAVRRAARFIAAGESEGDLLANHHAMACLALWKAYELLGDPTLEAGFERLWEGFVRYHDFKEGWSREYDGVDPGYLSATVSFLAKIYQTHPDPKISEVLRQSVEFCSYFVYPDGSYAGSLGSRNTLHFYPHGFEILAGRLPLAAAVAERMLRGLADGKLVPPEIMSDRYVFYRVPEYLQAHLDRGPRPADLPPLPYEQEPIRRYFPRARIFVLRDRGRYVIANLAKGGVVKVFDAEQGRPLMSDCGLIGQLADGRVVTSQWVDEEYRSVVDDGGWEVSGHLHVVPSHKTFTPLTGLIFRLVLVALGWSQGASHWLKRRIRRAMMVGRRPVPVRFRRRFRVADDAMTLTDDVEMGGGVRFTVLSAGDEFFVRYVPQSRFFQSQELDVQGYHLSGSELEALNANGRLRLRREVPLVEAGPVRPAHAVWTSPGDEQSGTSGESPPVGVYGVDYHAGRLRNRQLIYRLRRRTEEVERALRRYGDGQPWVVVDVGTADGLMLDKLNRRIPGARFVGLDLTYALLRANPASEVPKVQGDALTLPVKSGAADAVIATAVIEHVPDGRAMLLECARVLRPRGVLVLTTPDPLMEHLASAIGFFKDAGHQRTFKLAELKEMVRTSGFEVLEARKFMFSPVGFPAERPIERIFGPLGFKLLMANQLLVARRE